MFLILVIHLSAQLKKKRFQFYSQSRFVENRFFFPLKKPPSFQTFPIEMRLRSVLCIDFKKAFGKKYSVISRKLSWEEAIRLQFAEKRDSVYTLYAQMKIVN